MSGTTKKGFTIARKMMLFGMVVFIVLMVSTYVKYNFAKSAEHNFNIYTNKAVAGKVYVLEIGKDLNYISRCTRDIMLGNAYEKNIAKIKKSRNNIIKGFDKLKQTMIGTPKEQEKLSRLKDAKTKTLAFIDDGFGKMKSLNNVEQTPQILADMYRAYKEDATPLANASRTAFSKIIEYKNKGLAKRTKMYHNEMTNLEQYMLLELVILLILIMGYLGVLTKSISASLDAFKEGLISFFSFMNGQNKEVKAIRVTSRDEFGVMAELINKNIETTKQSLANEKELLDEASVVIARVKHGWYSQLIEKNTDNEVLNTFKTGINEMIKATKEHFNTINLSLEEYANYNYTKALVVKDIETGGVFELLVKDINTLRLAINEMLKDNKQVGLTLNESARVLLNNVDELSTNSNTAAASLEETAAAVDEITSNIANSNEKITQMSALANEVTNSAQQGEQLATQTTASMDEINTQVEAINDAITVIDQIAFQTNILSLNAAVEAATAGEAGKGFAVVAAEVRNLASRSAEAAKEIKTLVESATFKANEGKSISDKMIVGYESLNDNIKQTIELIADVSTVSKEQQEGIVQINDAINRLDQQTQANASIARQTNDVAKNTSNIAEEIVNSADAKEFEGKNAVKAKTVDSTQKRTKQPTQPTVPQPKKEIPQKDNNNIIAAHNDDDDEWESF